MRAHVHPQCTCGRKFSFRSLCVLSSPKYPFVIKLLRALFKSSFHSCSCPQSVFFASMCASACLLLPLLSQNKVFLLLVITFFKICVQNISPINFLILFDNSVHSLSACSMEKTTAFRLYINFRRAILGVVCIATLTLAILACWAWRFMYVWFISKLFMWLKIIERVVDEIS